MSRMIGTARQPTLSSWCTIEVKRKRRGCVTTRSSATTSAPSMLTMAANELPTEAMLSPIEADRGGERIAAAVRRRLLRLDAVHLVHQRAVVFLEPGHRGVAAARRKAARQPLQQPGAEGVELVDPAHVDVDALDGAAALGRGVDLRLQAAGVLGHPGAGAGEPEPLALRRAFEQYAAHATKPLISHRFRRRTGGIVRRAALDPRA